MRFSRAQVGWLVGITALAAGLRLWGAWQWPLWIDEAHTWRDATMPIESFLAEDRAKYPLPFLLLRGLLALGWSETEGALRLPFVLVGIATIPALACSGRQIVGARAALFAAFLLAIHPWHVFWSQNARGYVIVVAATVFTAQHVLLFARHDRMRDLVLAGIAILVAMASHATGALLTLGVVAFLLLRRFRLGARTMVCLAVVAAVAAYVLPWLIEASKLFDDFLRQKSTPSLPHFLQTTGYYFRPGVLVAAALGLWLLRQVAGRDRAIVLGCVSAVPLFVLLVCGSNLVLTTARYGICVLPVLAWLSAFAVVRVGRSALAATWPSRAAAWAATAAVPVLLVADHAGGLYDYYAVQNGQRAYWREAAEFLRARAGGQPLRVVTVNYPTMLYYLRPGDWRFQVPPELERNRVVSIEPWMIRDGTDENGQMAYEPGAKNHVQWHREMAARDGAVLAFVVTLPELMQKDPDHSLRSALASQFELVLHLPCWVGPKDESLFVYLPKQP
jgi:uncharacterized membrane protein